MIHTPCPQCSRTVRVRPEAIGTTVDCPWCRVAFVVPPPRKVAYSDQSATAPEPEPVSYDQDPEPDPEPTPSPRRSPRPAAARSTHRPASRYDRDRDRDRDYLRPQSNWLRVQGYLLMGLGLVSAGAVWSLMPITVDSYLNPGDSTYNIGLIAKKQYAMGFCLAVAIIGAILTASSRRD